MDTNHQRLWRKFNALFNGYKLVISGNLTHLF